MKVNSEIFRAYDIRGIFEERVNSRFDLKIGQAVGSVVLEEKSKTCICRKRWKNFGRRCFKVFYQMEF